ncbi:MAG: cell division protein FtsL [Pseudomonadota bacterium]
MLRHGLALLALTIIAIAGWAYSVNYNTMTAFDRVRELRGQIAEEREALQVLRVEWAWLNAPDRLQRLTEQFASQLQLVPLVPDVLSHTAIVPFPEDPATIVEIAPVIDRTGLIPVPVSRPAAWRAE